MITSPIRPQDQQEQGIAAASQLTRQGRLTALHSRSPPPRTYGFFQTRPHGSPPAQPAASKPPGELRAAPLPHQCWVPPVRAPGQDSHLRSQQHARHTRLAPRGSPSRRRSIRGHPYRDRHYICQGRLKTDPLAPVENGPLRAGQRPVVSWSIALRAAERRGGEPGGRAGARSAGGISRRVPDRAGAGENGRVGGRLRPSAPVPRPIGQALSARSERGRAPRSLSRSR